LSRSSLERRHEFGRCFSLDIAAADSFVCLRHPIKDALNRKTSGLFSDMPARCAYGQGTEGGRIPRISAAFYFPVDINAEMC